MYATAFPFDNLLAPNVCATAFPLPPLSSCATPMQEPRMHPVNFICANFSGRLYFCQFLHWAADGLQEVGLLQPTCGTQLGFNWKEDVAGCSSQPPKWENLMWISGRTHAGSLGYKEKQVCISWTVESQLCIYRSFLQRACLSRRLLLTLPISEASGWKLFG